MKNVAPKSKHWACAIEETDEEIYHNKTVRPAKRTIKLFPLGEFIFDTLVASDLLRDIFGEVS